tara:strand:- start:91 stop:270 length:180 start_codon:yes stop_codon:yes gene_type:complete
MIIMIVQSSAKLGFWGKAPMERPATLTSCLKNNGIQRYLDSPFAQEVKHPSDGLNRLAS